MDELSRAYEVVKVGAALVAGGNDHARALRLIARAALVTLAHDRSAIEAANLARSLAEELDTL
jgi:hypothetical protein